MGFFAPDSDTQPALRRVKLVVPAAPTPLARGCEHCTLKASWPQLLTPQMPLAGSPKADLLVLGEAPGEQEDLQGVPFVGDSGQLLRQYMPQDFTRRLAWQNTVRCRPPKNRKPSPAEAHACGVHLESDVQRLPNLKAVLGFGGAALGRFLSEETIRSVHGLKFPIKLADKVVWYYPVLHPAFVLRNGGDNAGKNPTLPIFKSNLDTFFKTVDRWPEPLIYKFRESDVVCAYTPEEVTALLTRMKSPVAVDIETTGLRPFVSGAKILTAAASDGATTVAWPLGHPEADNDWGWPLLNQVVSTRHWIAHNAAFELLWFWHRNGTAWRPAAFQDTMCMGRIWQGREGLLSLATQTRLHLGCNIKQLANVDPKKILEYPLDRILVYNGLDAYATAVLWHVLEAKLTRSMHQQIDRMLGTVKSVVLMEILGLNVDLNTSRLQLVEYTEKAKQAEAAARKLYEVRQYELEHQTEFNIGSNDHVATALVKYGRVTLPKTPGGKASTGDEFLEEAAKTSPLAATVRTYRANNKVITTYIDPILKRDALGTDGLIHPGYTVAHTRTLRLSGNNMNIQNWPKRDSDQQGVRKQIVPPKGFVLVPIDYGQLEARIIAMASGDRNLCDAQIRDYDIHGEWRDNLEKKWPHYLDLVAEKNHLKDAAKILKAARNEIKNDFVFQQCFGGSPKAAAARIGAPEDIMYSLAEDFWTTFPGVRNWIKAQRAQYRNTGTVTTLTGRERNSILFGQEAINTPVQGSAQDIVLTAQNRLTELALKTGDLCYQPRINVHDDLTFILPDHDDKLESYLKEIMRIMTDLYFDWQIVPLVVEVSAGPNWADVREIKRFKGDYIR